MLVRHKPVDRCIQIYLQLRKKMVYAKQCPGINMPKIEIKDKIIGTPSGLIYINKEKC
jgi:hypothetical protein